MKSRWLLLGALIFAWPGLAETAARADILGITIGGDQLIRINTTTGAGTLIGTVPASMQAFGIGFRGTQLYAYDQVADLVRELDPASGAILNSINIGAGDLDGEGGLDFRSDGLGFLAANAGATGRLFQFDVTVPNSTPVTPAGGLVPSMDGLAFDSSDILYGLSQGDTDLGSKLYIINQTTGATTLVGALGVGSSARLGGLTFDTDGTLYAAISGGSAAASTLYRVNKSTGAATLVGDIGFTGVSGLATQAVVPEPNTLLLLSLGSLSLLAYRRPMTSPCRSPGDAPVVHPQHFGASVNGDDLLPDDVQ